MRSYVRRYACFAVLLMVASCAPQVTPEAGVAAFISDEGIPAGVLAIGTAGQPPRMTAWGTRTDARFRVASLSKPLTAAAVFQLIRNGKLKLTDQYGGATIAQLLQHSGGWDRVVTGDRMLELADFANQPKDCLSFAKTPHQFEPGRRFVYSNLGYCWLGHAIEQASGKPYETYVLEDILRPAGIEMAMAGGPGSQPDVAHPSGWPEAAYRRLGPVGGWVANADAMFRFASLPIDPLVQTKPAYAEAGKTYFGLGWRIWPDGTISHFGAIPAIYAIMLRKGDKIAVALFNKRPKNDEDAVRRLKAVLMP